MAIVLWSAGAFAQQEPFPGVSTPAEETAPPAPVPLVDELRLGLSTAAIRLPLAALLGAILALRPRKAGSPPRDPAVIETQIVLAIVGALIMIVVGASLARAFGIAGAANLIRYRAKIEDPKDAVVMLSTLSVGLASGVGLFGLAAGATVFLMVTLSIIESFERRVRTFLLKIRLGEGTSGRSSDVEQILRGARTVFELRTTSDDELSYLVTADESVKTESLSAALTSLVPNGGTIEWKEEKKARPLGDDEE
jgi:uncharacterized membrane protein YhiD involved in acid resistance